MPKRVKASLIHLLISISLVSSVLVFVVFLWYPSVYFGAMGVGKMLLILASVDVTIGPLITLIIFNPAKPSLKFDLAIIAVLQLSALMYGVGVVFMGRPVYAVYNVDMFTIVSAVDIPEVELHKAGIQSLPIWGPRIVGARLPVDGTERKAILFSALNGGPDLPQMPRYYLPYETVANDVKARMLPLNELLKRQKHLNKPEVKSSIDEIMMKQNLQPADLAFVPMRGKERDLTVLIRRKDARIVSILSISPWGQ